MYPMLNIAIRAARKTGTVINRVSFNVDSLRIERKQHNNLVTEVDHAAETAIIEVIKTAYPDHTILVEESGQSWADGETASENVWVIGSLDGTIDFIHDFPQYGVSIALIQRGVVTQVMVYDSTRDGPFTASKGAGAFLNNRHIHVTHRGKLTDCLIGVGFPYRDLEGLCDYTRLFATMTEDRTDLRRPDATVFDLAYVAHGRLDNFFEQGLGKWDMTAGSLPVTESGGLVGNYTGEPGYLDQDEILAGNPKTFVQMTKFTSPFLRSRAEA